MTDTTPHYHINVFFSEPDGCWIAAVPDLQNCNAHGESPEEALREIQVAMELWLECWMEDFDAPPPARYKPAPLPVAG